MSYWDMYYSDQLKVALEEIPSTKQRRYFLKVFERMGEYVRENDQFITFREYLTQEFGRN